MKNFKQKSLYLALAAGMTMSGLATAGGVGNGMYISSDGLGQVLLFPYYTTRNNLDTYLSVVNTTGQTKAVKVRFLESRNSREVLDFNLYLSPYDMWTAAVVNDSAGAKVVTRDKSCTTPAIPEDGEPFVNYAYTGEVIDDGSEDDNVLTDGINIGGADGATGSLDRTREGYFEIIEMGVVGEDEYEDAIKHVNGVPKDCDKLQDLVDLEPDEGEYLLDIDTPTGGLTGTASLVSPSSGTDFSYDPVVIGNFAYREIWHEAGTIDPDLRHGRDRSMVFYDKQVVDSKWDDAGAYTDMKSVRAVNALLMHNNLINEFVLDKDTLSGTDWVVTMPTKRYSVPIWDGKGTAPDIYPPFDTTFGADGACESVRIDYWNREEGKKQIAKFSPPVSGQTTKLCWEANVITFDDKDGNSSILGSAHPLNVDIADGFENGWMRMNFSGNSNHTQVSNGGTANGPDGTHIYYGLPVIGFMVQDFVNQAAAPGVMATYGGNFKHKYTTDIEGPGVDRYNPTY